jgi:2-dehydropantoate 2-reductase
MPMGSANRIVIAGAGSVGCYVGGMLLRAGRDVRLFGRPRMAEELSSSGLHITDLDGADFRISAADVPFETDPSVMSAAAVVLVTVKSHATDEIADLIAGYAPDDALVVSLQNGVTNAARLRRRVGARRVFAGMVPFNVLHRPPGGFHRGTSGVVTVEAGERGLSELLSVDGLPVAEDHDPEALLWGKLLLNLNNALNALSGLPLRQQLDDRRWRRLLAAQLDEALPLLKAAGIRPRRLGPIAPSLLPSLLRLPTRQFRLIAAGNLRIDPQARSSMWEDLERSRRTEIDELQGAIVALAERLGRVAPVNARVAEMVRAAERAGTGSPRLQPDALL